MAFGFANSASTGSVTGAQTNTGPDLELIETEGLGFLSIAGDTKLRLLPSPWPDDALPPPTASLLAVASVKGLIAAAGPDTLVIATTESVRRAFAAEGPKANNVKAFTPQATLSIPRVSQVAFSSDGSSLVIAAETGGGLAVYDVQSIMQGNKEPAFQLGTNGIAVRALIPNPATDAAHFFSIVLTGGQLMLANLKERQFVNGANGPVLKDGVSCVAWSNRGKQLVAGLGNGTAYQMDPQGVGKADIPKPPQVEGEQHVSSIFWLANDDFLVIHTPMSSTEPDHPPESTYNLVHREKGTSNYSFHKLPDPCPPFGMNRSPPHHFICRLKDFPPSLDDMLIISSTASQDVGLFTRSGTPLDSNLSADQITNTYTTTTPAIDSRRAGLPVTEEMTDTSPIGMALDLSSKEKVPRPIQGNDLEETSTPLPAVMLLNNEGVLCSWWVVYSQSVMANTAYPGLVATGGARQVTAFGGSASSALSSGPGNPTPMPNAFGGGAFAKPAAPSFGSAGAPGFGGASLLGGKPSLWSTPAATTNSAQAAGAAFGKPAFGASSLLAASSGNAFGAVGGLGNRASPWASSTNSQQASNTTNPFGGVPAAASPFAKLGSENKPAVSPFGNLGGENKPPVSSFANMGGSKPAASPFAGLGITQPAPSPFAGLGANKAPSSSPFAGLGQQTSRPFGATPQQSFGSPIDIDSSMGGSFGAPSTVGSRSPWPTPSANATPAQGSASVFGEPSLPPVQSEEATMTSDDDQTSEPADKPQGLLSNGASNFRLGSTFQGDGSAKDDGPNPKDPGNSMFGDAFGSALGDAAKSPVTPIKKEPGTEEEQKLSDISTTPASSPKTGAEPSTGGFVDGAKPTPFSPPTKPTEAKKVLPESSVSEEESAVEAEDAPLPPDMTHAQAKKAIEDLGALPIAGSPPVDLGEEISSSLSSVDDSAPSVPDGESQRDEAVSGDEGGIDEDSGKENEDPSGTRNQSASVLSPSQVQKQHEAPALAPSPLAPPPSAFPSPTTPAGFPKSAPFFPPPHPRDVPRLPSPLRSASTPNVGPADRTSQALPSQPLAVPPLRPISRPVSQGLAPKPAEPVEELSLSDDEDERIRAELTSPVVATTKLDSFLAHQDYAGRVNKSGIPGQIERVYRDINSMIDTLGLNARALKAFVKGHAEGYKEGGRERGDLEIEDDWCLVEIEDLGQVKNSIEQALDSGRIADVDDKRDELAQLRKDCAKLRTRTLELKKRILAHTDPGKVASARAAPLTAEVAMQRSDLRKDFAEFQRLLQEAEEGLSVLRARLASASAASSQLGAITSRATPTVEAVTNTILKMTAMVERKSGDIDVLEFQMRKLRSGMAGLSLGGHDGADGHDRASPDSSPFATPPTSRGRLAASQLSNGSAAYATPLRQSHRPTTTGTYGLFYSPDSDLVASTAALRLGDSGRSNGSARKKMAQVGGEEIVRFNAKAERRRAVLERLREVVQKRRGGIEGQDAA